VSALYSNLWPLLDLKAFVALKKHFGAHSGRNILQRASRHYGAFNAKRQKVIAYFSQVSVFLVFKRASRDRRNGSGLGV
jgi:hypothetical protein